MTLVLRDVQQPGPGLRNLLGELARLVVENVENLPYDASSRIHDIRVSTKKIRSLLRLADSEISGSERSALVVCLRDIKNAFSGSRDEEVMRQRLREIFSAEQVEEIEEKLALAPPEASPQIAPSSAAANTTELSFRLTALNLDALTPDHLVKNAASSYRKARKVMQRCKKSSGDEVMHEWRKRVKDVFYHAMAFSSLSSMEKQVPPLDALAELLGEYHDLALLGVRAADHKKIRARVSAAQRKVGKRCFTAARALFAPTAGKFARELGCALRQP